MNYTEYEDICCRMAASIRLGIDAEDAWDGPSIKPGTLTDEEIEWLASWLAGDGWVKK